MNFSTPATNFKSAKTAKIAKNQKIAKNSQNNYGSTTNLNQVETDIIIKCPLASLEFLFYVQ